MLPAAIALFAPAPPDPMRLPIGRPGETVVRPGLASDLRRGTTASLPNAVIAPGGPRWFFVGETHATREHQLAEAALVRARHGTGEPVAVGVEFVTRPKQPVLDRWTAGELTEEEFLREVDWKGQWGFDYAFYRPLFDACREHRIPMVALNVPRDWVRAVGRGGIAALGPRRAEIGGDLALDVRDHRRVFEALLGGHPVTGAQGENIYAAQVLWDEAMADTALKWRAEKGFKGSFFVIAGAGHMMYGQGINQRIARRTGERGVNILLVTADPEGTTVANGIADWVVGRPK